MSATPDRLSDAADPPLTMSFDVACAVEHAFATWTNRISTWWPRDHTVSGVSGAEIFLQQHVGGRIFEREPGGAEHLWGQVTVWEPPTRLAYLWHLGRTAAEATEVDIRFAARGDAATTVRIEHRGWQALGATAGIWRDRNRAGWDSLLPHYLAAL